MRVSSYTTVSVRSALVRSCKWHWEVWHRLKAVKQKLGILPKNQLQPPVFHQFSKNPQDFPKLSSKNQDIPIIHSNHVPIYHIPPGHFPIVFPRISAIFPLRFLRPKSQNGRPSPGTGRRCAPPARWHLAEGPAPGVAGEDKIFRL